MLANNTRDAAPLRMPQDSRIPTTAQAESPIPNDIWRAEEIEKLIADARELQHPLRGGTSEQP
ncbi:MAG: hypothetical protein OXC09_06220 [Truepera sp.]|nr:hypothetical protein [Truepera sp.]